MNRNLVALALCTLPLVAGAPAGAAATVGEVIVGIPDISDDSPAVGPTCGLLAITDPFTGDARTGVIFGGALVATSPGASVELTCSVHLGPQAATHAGADECSETAGPSTAAVTLLPAPCSFEERVDAEVYVCTELTVAETTYYWNSEGVGGLLPGVWSTNVDTPCKVASTQEV